MLRQAHDALGRDDGRTHAVTRPAARSRRPMALGAASRREQADQYGRAPEQPSSLDVGALWHFSRSLGGRRRPAHFPVNQRVPTRSMSVLIYALMFQARPASGALS